MEFLVKILSLISMKQPETEEQTAIKEAGKIERTAIRQAGRTQRSRYRNDRKR